MSHQEVIVIGAGLSGLYCAALLGEAGRRVRVLEASDAVGGRVRTDVVDGFTLNRGFQVFLDSYPEAARALNYDALDLRAFNSGAAVWTGSKFEYLFDPTRHPTRLKAAIASPLLTWGDRLRVIKLWADVRFGDAASLLTHGEEKTTMAELVGRGFSKHSIDSFFRPFFGGVLLSPELTTSNCLFKYLFRMFATGRATLPAKGMQAIPEQLATRARNAGVTIKLHARVHQIEEGVVSLDSGERCNASAIVIATESDSAASLLGQSADVSPRGWNGEWTFYFAAARPPVAGPTLVLNGVPNSGPVNDLAIISEAAPTYAPPGQSLISATVVGRLGEDVAALENEIRLQLAPWFGTAVADWRFLKAYKIPQALPDFTPPQSTTPKSIAVRPGVFLCGDHREQASIQGALVSGRRAADAVLSTADGSSGVTIAASRFKRPARRPLPRAP